MTIIFVAKKNKNKLMMAGDRRLTMDESGHYSQDPNPKIRKIGKAIIGGAGSASGCDLFFTLKSLKHLDKVSHENLNNYLQNVVVQEYRDVLVTKGHVFKDRTDVPDIEPYNEGSAFLIIIKGRVFEIVNGPNTIECCELSAPVGIGCGAVTATAINHTINRLDILKEPRDKLNLTIKLTAELNAGCDDTVDILSE